MARSNQAFWRGMIFFLAAFAVLAWTVLDVAETTFPRVLPWSQDAAKSDEPTAPSGDNGGQGNAEYRISEIVQAHLFGNPSRAAPQRAVQAPETKLRLNLMGLIASSDQQLARAIIGVNGAGAKSYSVGQSIEGTDAAVYSVERLRVLLRRGEALESLALKRQLLSGSESGPELLQTEYTEDSARSDTRVREFQERIDKNGLKLPF